MKRKFALYEGYLLAFLSYLIWGILPVYWKQLSELSAIEIMANRVFWSAIFLVIMIRLLKKKGFLSYLKNKKTRMGLIATSLLITVNWSLFIYAVNSGKMVQASLGYYINPLVSVLLAMVVLKEKLKKPQIFAIFLAFLGVTYLAISAGVVPWISLILAISFAIYGLLKKIMALDSMISLLIELLITVPIAFLAFVQLAINGQNHFFTSDVKTVIFMILAGVVTVIPLYLFAEGAKKIPLSAIGFLQYIAPTMMLLLGVLLYGEKFTMTHAVSFALIWVGLLIYSGTVLWDMKKKNSP